MMITRCVSTDGVRSEPPLPLGPPDKGRGEGLCNFRQRRLRAINVLSVFAILALALSGIARAQGLDTDDAPAAVQDAQTVRFQALDIFIDSGAEALAAYQLDITAGNAGDGAVRVVGIEGGEHTAFADPPYYDPKAMHSDRVIIADFNTANADHLPSGRTRIATIHVQITGDIEPKFDAKLIVAATIDGRAIPGQLDWVLGP